MKTQKTGTIGEKEIVRLIPCPNCTKKLMALPKNYPLYDVQCTSCLFRAQVKTNNTKAKAEVFGAGWSIIEKVIKSGYTIPPLIANFKWKEKGKRYQKVIFYPFIPKRNLKVYQLSEKHRQAGYKMFNYVRLNELPSQVLFPKSKSIKGK